MSKKYLVVAGYVTSKTDGDQHYIGASDLMRLYDVSRAECLVANPRMDKDQMRKLAKDLIVLQPLYHGDYEGYLDANKKWFT